MISNKHGQTLIEVIIALAVAVILALALITTSLVTQKAARSARNQSQATKLAQEYLEQIRVFRDRNGYTMLINGTCVRLNGSDPASWTLGTSGCPEPVPLGTSTFYRKFDISDDPVKANQKIVKVIIEWTDQAGPQSITSQTVLTNWENIK